MTPPCATPFAAHARNVPVVAAGLLLLAGIPAAARAGETGVLSFEDAAQRLPACLAAAPESVRVTPERAKYGAQSLRWDWRAGESLAFRNTGGIAFAPLTPESPDNRLSTFSVWVCNPAALPGETLRFEFGRGGADGFERDCWFDFGLDFTGWRTCWVAYGRDMQGKPRADMDALRIIAPDADGGGTLFIDSLVFSHPVDARHHTRDAQVPFVNTAIARQANDHWSALLRFDRQPPPGIPLPADAREAARTLDARYASLLPEPAATKPAPGTLEKLRARFSAWQIRRAPGGGTTGRAVYYPYEKDAYPENSLEFRESSSPQSSLAAFNQLLHDLALACRAPGLDEGARAGLRGMFLDGFDHLRDQGWQHGSAQGAVHHLGYSMRRYYSALYLMRDTLRETGRLGQARDDMAWFSGAGRACTPPGQVNGESIDTFNTILPGQIAACLMIGDEDLRARWLAITARWLGRALEPSDGLMGGIAPDGGILHHCNHYPAYAIGGIQGAAEALWIFSNTSLRVPAAGHASLRRAMLNLRFHSNVLDWPLSLSGRHPTGAFALDAQPYLFLALSGAPGGRGTPDAEMLAVWKRLDAAQTAARTTGAARPDPLAKKLLRLAAADPVALPAASVEKMLRAAPETPPAGHLTLSHATTAAHRRADWLVTARGFSRYLWGSEIYPGANMYGRYLAYGHVEILARGHPISVSENGYAQDGWDWNCWPGTTAIHLPPGLLRARVNNVDIHSGREEMLLSDEAFAGGSNLGGRNGVFAMKLHEHAKYDGSHRARKSVFFFDDRIILLGSGVTNDDNAHATRTTLFQNHLPRSARSAPLRLDGRPALAGFPAALEPPARSGASACVTLDDTCGNTYLVLDPGAGLRVTKSTQRSRSQDDRRDTGGDFVLAWLDHGAAPKNAGYACAILVQPGAARADAFAAELLRAAAGPGAETPPPRAAPFAILRRDDTAHIVRDRDTGILAAACFEPVAGTGLALDAVDRPALVMLRAEQNGGATLSVCDPDLHLYEGVEPDQLNPDGTQREVSLYSRRWARSPGAPSIVRVTLRGDYAPPAPSPLIRALPSPAGRTVLAITCRDGLPVETTLAPAENRAAGNKIPE